jgi:flavin reductase (DIM6/NTAB) family NADH-FMN oxidoreductase RutF
VYSLATLNEDGSTNMNIVTFATPVSIEPRRVWAVSLYKHTLSRENFEARGGGVLQVGRCGLAGVHTPHCPVAGVVRV